MLKDQIEKEVASAQNEIMRTLQALHEKTGMIPREVSFEALDVRRMEDCGVRNRILISNVRIEATT